MRDLVPNESEFILYTTPEGDVRLDVLVLDESIWLTQKGMANLFGVVKSTISEHLSNIYSSTELSKEATVRKIRTVRIEGERKVNRNLEFYNLDNIISVGYRVNSVKARNTFTIESLADSVNKFLSFNEYKILKVKGKMTHIRAITKAEKEYDLFNITQRIESDFDEQIKKLESKEK